MKTKLTKKRWFAVLIAVIMVLTVSCEGPTGPEGPSGPKGDKGDVGAKGDKGDTGNANVKYTDWIAFAPAANWVNHRADFVYFKHHNDAVFKFSAQTVKDIFDGKYITLCYIRNADFRYTWNLPAFLASSDFTEFGNGRKMVNYATFANATSFYIEINISSTDGSDVKGAQGKWLYRLIFIGVNGGPMKSPGKTNTLQQELEKLSYEEVCEHYNIEP